MKRVKTFAVSCLFLHIIVAPQLHAQDFPQAGVADTAPEAELLARLKSPDWQRRLDAVSGLQKSGSRQAVEPLIQILNDPSENSYVRIQAAKALGELHDSRALQPLSEALKSSEGGLRDAAAEALAAMGGEQATEALSAAYRQSPGPVLEKAFFELHKKSFGRFVRRPDAVPDTTAISALADEIKKGNRPDCDADCIFFLSTHTDDPDMTVRISALATLSVLDNAYALKKLVLLLGETGAAEKPLAAIGKPAVPLLAERLAGDNATARETVRIINTLCDIRDAGAIAPLIRALKRPDIETRWAAARALGLLGDPAAVEPLITALKDEKETVREIAVASLGALGDPRAIQPLCEVMKTSDYTMRQAAAQALEKIGWQPDTDSEKIAFYIAAQNWDKCVEAGAPAVPALIELLHDPKAQRFNAAEALGKIGDRRAVEPLLLLLSQSAEPPGTLLTALCRLGDERALSPLINVLAVKQYMYIAEAVACFGKPALQPLLEELRKGDKVDAIVEALGYLGGPAVEPLTALLDDPDPQLRRNAVKALGLTKDSRATVPLMAVLEKESNAEALRAEAAASLGNLQDGRVVPALIRAFKGNNPEIHRGAQSGLRTIGTPALKPLAEVLKDDDPANRVAAARTLGYMRDNSTAAAIAACLDDPVQAVREAAVEALCLMQARREIPLLVKALDDRSDTIRVSASKCLERLGWKPETQEERIASAAGNLAQGDNVNKCVAIGKPAVEKLVSIVQDTEARLDIRMKAAEALGRIRDPTASASAATPPSR